jgi:group I intron endonuclease
MNKQNSNYPGIYKATNSVNGKVYIGQAQNCRKRIQDHKWGYSKYQSLFYFAIRKHGIDSFQFEIIECVLDCSTIDNRENYWIEFYQSYNRNFGYNLARYAKTTRGIFKSEREKAAASLRMSKKVGKLNSFFGKKHSKESIQQMREVKVGKKTAEHVKKLMSNKRKMEMNARAVMVLNTDYGIFYGCIKEAAAAVGLPHSTLRSRLNPRSEKRNRHSLVIV